MYIRMSAGRDKAWPFVMCLLGIMHLFLHTNAYKPKILGDFSGVVGAVLFGSRVRYDVMDFNLCDVSIPGAMQLRPFMVEVQSVDFNRGSDSFGDGVIVTSHEQEMPSAGYGNQSLILRQIQTYIRFDGSASIYVLDYQPGTFKVYADATLECVWHNGTDNAKAAGMRIWAQQWQATEMGTLDRLAEGVSQGHVIFFYVDAGLTTPPQYRSYWAGAVHDISNENGTITFYSESVSQTNVIGMTITTQQEHGNVTIRREVTDRRTGVFVTGYSLTGKFGYDTAVHFYWKNLFAKGRHS